jgi:peptidoglycan/LPS O-acetylase OafA/YrhL
MTVVGIHLGVFAGITHRQDLLLAPATVFFALSGFLITRNLLVEREVHGEASLTRFWWNRFLRILPCYALFIVAVALCSNWGYITPVSGKSLTMSSLYASNFINKFQNVGPLGSTWSLAVEEHFYLFWPVVFVFVRPRALARVTLIALAICIAVRAVLTWHPGAFAHDYVLRFTIPAMDAILVGCLLAIWLGRRGRRIVPRAASARPLLYGAFALGLYAAPLWIPVTNVDALDYSAYYVQLAGIAIGLWWMFTNQSAGIIRVLEVRPLVFLGTISYGIYVWQGLWLGTGTGDQRHLLQHLPWSIVVVLATATASWYLVERPLLRFKRSASGSTPPLGAPEARQPAASCAVVTRTTG